MEPNQWTSWGPAGAILLTFGSVLGVVSRFAGPLITSWVQQRNEESKARQKLAEDVTLHQSERDARLTRIESSMDRFERRLSRMSGVMYSRCGKHEEPDSGIDEAPKEKPKAT